MPLLCFNWGLAGRCAHKTPAIGGRFPHLRPEKCKLSHTGKSAKRRRWRMKRAGFEEVARLARPKGRGNRNATTVTSEKTIQIYFASANAKVCDAFLMQMAYAPYGTFAACGRRDKLLLAGNAEAFPAFLYLRKTLGDGREGIPFFQLTGREQYDNLSVDDISVTVITGDERRDATWERRR